MSTNSFFRDNKKPNPLNIVAQCRYYSTPFLQCPAFLVVLTGILNIATMVGTYFVAMKYTSPEIVALIVIFISAIFTIISFLIIKSFEKLAESNRLKSEFVSIASHQLRTPLTGIKWAINLMMSEDVERLDEEKSDRLKTIKESNQRMIDLVNDLLNISRIEQGRLGLKPEEIDLKEITKELEKEYIIVAKSKNLTLSFQIEKDLPKIKADKQGIQLVMHNLIDNAIRYSPQNGKVDIRMFSKNSSVRCEVEDNGVGIPKDDQKRIFQKFFRSRNVLKYQTEGTGLGLFIAKAIVDSSKGKIGFQSKENKGSTFWVELPIKK